MSLEIGSACNSSIKLWQENPTRFLTHEYILY